MNKNTTILFLTLLTLVHTLFSISGFIFIFFLVLGIQNNFIDFLVIGVIFSFIFFRRCIMTDLYYFVKGDIKDEEIPFYAKENFGRRMLKVLLGKDYIKKDITHFRLDVVSNLKVLRKVCNNEKLFNVFYSRKIQYISFNLILCVLMISKYNKNYLLVPLMIWFFVYLGIH